jgi:hypothetical protein
MAEVASFPFYFHDPISKYTDRDLVSDPGANVHRFALVDMEISSINDTRELDRHALVSPGIVHHPGVLAVKGHFFCDILDRKRARYLTGFRRAPERLRNKRHGRVF